MFVRLIAKPNTWFKEGTEVFSAFTGKRITAEEFDDYQKVGSILAVGTRVCQEVYELSLGFKPEEEREDEKLCDIDEFSVEYINES